MPTRILTVILFLAAIALARYDIVGVVVEVEGDRPIAHAELLYASGRELTKADSRGRFQARVTSRNAKLILRRAGFVERAVDLAEYGDLLDLVLAMESDARDLGQAIVSGRQAPTRGLGGKVPLRSLEDAAGLRFDLTEHLAQMPGVAGQKDFSGELSYLGSRPDELAYALGSLPIPNMRHLDVGFPGNLSVINPRMLAGLQIHDHLASGPLQQGLAGAVQLDPADVDGQDFVVGTSLGTTAREFRVQSPWFFGDGIALSFRYLDPDMLRNMGEKFFTTFRRPEESCQGCRIESRENQFQLSSWDLMAHISSTDTAGGASGFTLLYSLDQYKISQDTAGRLDRLNSSDILRGHQQYMIASYQMVSATGIGLYTGWVRESRGDTLRDTAAFLPDGAIAGDEAFRNYIDGGEVLTDKYTVGGDMPLPLGLFGGRYNFASEYQLRQHERTFIRDGAQRSLNADGNQLHALLRSSWTTENLRMQVALGAVSNLTNLHAPLASINAEHPWPGVNNLRMLGGLAWRAQERIVGSGDLYTRMEGAAMARLGANLEIGRLQLLGQGFGRYYPSPVLPEPKALWHYAEQAVASRAWVSGAALQVQWRSLHNWALTQNWATTYGEYDLGDGSSLPWPANTRLEAASHLRWYPRSDSVLSLILSHRASWQRPLYAWNIGLWSRDVDGVYVDGTREIRSQGEYLDLFRTDMRVNLDLSSRWPPLREVRFYVEANNVFAMLDISSLRWLGAPNVRERSVVTTQVHSEGFVLTPYLADGMGFYLQFGVEGSLGF